MAAKLFRTNWKNAEAWTAGLRDPASIGQPVPDAVSCSVRWADPAWQQKPIAGVTTLFGTAVNITYYNSAFGGGAGNVHDQIGQYVVSRGWDKFNLIRTDGAIVRTRIVNYDEGPTGTQTYLINLAISAACRWWAQKLFDLGGAWVDGLHIDYWTPPDIWVAYMAGYTGIYGNAAPTYAFNKEYMRGLSRTIHHYRALRASAGLSTLIIGQQYHNMNGTTDMRELDGRYIEQDPKRWSDAAGVTPWQTYHQSRFDSFTTLHGAGKSNMVVEDAVRGGIYNNQPYPNSTYQAEIMAFANTNNCYVSFGRDDLAGIGWPG